jgi:TolA-binding protein
VARAHEPSQEPGGPSPELELEQARERLSLRDISAARRGIEHVLSEPLADELRAEALSLRAECELLQGKPTAARDAYLDVFRRYPGLAAGENALFAAARSEAEHGSAERAAAYFESYLKRYPGGRFAKEATARLHALAPEPPP